MTDRMKFTVDNREDAERVQSWFPDADVTMRRKGTWVDVVLLWFTLVGVWPFADPAHDWSTTLGFIDLAIHWVTAIVLAFRWRVVRR